VIEGTISKPDAKFDEIQAGFTSILNVLGNSVPAVLDGAGGAAGAAAGAASGLFQAIPFFGR